jgi:hypothetical protein
MWVQVYQQSEIPFFVFSIVVEKLTVLGILDLVHLCFPFDGKVGSFGS